MIVESNKKRRQRITYKSSPLPEIGFIRLCTVISLLQISKSSYLNGVKEGRYPAGKLLSPRTRVYPVEEIRALINKLNNDDAGE